MKIKRLIVHNYKLFSELDLMLQQRLNVFVGINGAGKTSLLEAIATLLSWYTDRFDSPTLSTSGWKIGRSAMVRKMPVLSFTLGFHSFRMKSCGTSLRHVKDIIRREARIGRS